MLRLLIENNIESLISISESEMKQELNIHNLDYTYIKHLYVKIENDNDNVVRYVRQLNFDFCISVIKKSKKNKNPTYNNDGW